jgi:peptide chain release factor 2
MILGGHFDLDGKQEELKSLELELQNPDIWNDMSKYNDLNQKYNELKKETKEYLDLKNSINDNIEFLTMSLEDDSIDISDFINDYDSIKEKLEEFETASLLNGEYDKENCYLEIHPGAGGTESCDWANMLLRMYTMFFDKFGFKYEIIDKLPGEEAGIKSVLIYIKGTNAYGYLKSEIGVHRLVRISPFNANGKRQTSFAAVNVTPEFPDVSKNIDVNEDDLRIDVYRSSGNGGQGVNTTDSAVRVTHIPTGIVVTCQNERSQIKNKETAIKVLKNKLYEIELKTREDNINSLKGNSNIDFGSQIRNYVLEPYTLVKDVRTAYETNNASKVLDGDLYGFINAYLRMKR